MTKYNENYLEKKGFRNPFLAVDIIIAEKDKIVLIKRGHDPFKDYWAFPAGFVEKNETVEQAAIRETKEETGLDIKLDGVVGVYSKIGRDPRGDVISVCFFAHKVKGKLKASSDAEEAKICNIKDAVKMRLAHDHNMMLNDYLRITNKSKK